MDTEILSNKKIFKLNFDEFLETINSLKDDSEKQLLADDLVHKAEQNGYPIFEDDSTVILLCQSDKKVFVIGDMTDWVEKVPMKNIIGTNLNYYKEKFENDARLEYVLEIKNGKSFCDPLNPFKVGSGLGNFSELAMPSYERHQVFDEFIHGKKGSYENLKEFILPEGALPYKHIVHVYLPPNYEKGKADFPVVYFNDGSDYIEFAAAKSILDFLIEEKKIKPIIAVFITPPNRHLPDEPNRMTEYGMNNDYVKFITDELVPFIDEKFKTKKDKNYRLIVGASYGGLISTYISFCEPEIFGLAYSQSGYHSFRKNEMTDLILSSERKDIKLFVDVGIYERVVGADFLPMSETNFVTGNRKFRDALIKKEYSFIYKEYHEGHTWGNWRRHLIDALQYFFGIKN